MWLVACLCVCGRCMSLSGECVFGYIQVRYGDMWERYEVSVYMWVDAQNMS